MEPARREREKVSPGVAATAKPGQPTEWIDKRDRMPTKADEDETGHILAFHVWDGVHISSAANFCANGGRYDTHWMPTPPKPPADPEYLKEVRALL